MGLLAKTILGLVGLLVTSFTQAQATAAILTYENIQGVSLELAVHNSDDGQTEAEFSFDDFVMLVTSEDDQIIYFITVRNIEIYKITNHGTRLEKKGSQPHKIQNAYHELIHGYCTHGYLALFKKYTMYYYKFLDDYQEMESNTTFPASYFGITRFTNMTAMNTFNNSIIMKSGPSEFVIIEFSSIINPNAIVYTTLQKKGEIRHITSVAKSKVVAVAFDKMIDFYYQSTDLGSKEPIRSYYHEFPVESMIYNPIHDSLIIVHYSKLPRDTQDGPIFLLKVIKTTLTIDNKGAFSHWSFNLNTSKQITQTKLSKLGENSLTSLNGKFMILYDITSLHRMLMNKILAMSYFTTYNLTGMANYSFNATYQLSNLILVTWRDTTNRKVYFKHVKFVGKDKFCHSSCGKYCTIPFVVCGQRGKVTLYFGMGIIGVIAILMGAAYLCVFMESSLNAKTSLRQKNLSKALKSGKLDQESLAAGNPVIKMRYSRMTPEMIHAVDGQPDQNLEDDEEMDKPFQRLKKSQQKESSAPASSFNQPLL